MRTPLLLALAGLTLATARAGDDARLLSMPAISSEANRLRLRRGFVDRRSADGKNARRLTSDLGVESNPVFSPDGSLLGVQRPV